MEEMEENEKAMKMEKFAADIGLLCAHAPFAREKPLVWALIANPTSGGFTIAARWRRNRAHLSAAAARAAALPAGVKVRGSLFQTRFPGHARQIVEGLLKEAAAAGNEARYLVLTAGGDGTSLEALSALFDAPLEIRSRFAVLRLPMGTGNDGADGTTMEESLEMLLRREEAVLSPALRLRTASGKGPFLAFNILSVGLDAFVTHMTNKMKGRLPGDSYKLWVDIASLLYDRLYRVGPMEVRAFDEAGTLLREFRETVLLLAVGVSGRRTYGSQKRILPDERNVCLVKQMPLLRKVALKDLFTTGEHIHKPESVLFSAAAVEFRGEHPILAQMDGETVLLEPGDFPAVIERTEPRVPLLGRA